VRTFSWLHLTDLHYGQQRQGAVLPVMLDDFFDDLKRMCEVVGPIHAVFFTGDLVFSGAQGQFEGLQEHVLQPLFKELRSLGSRNPVLLAVPGNHDVARQPAPDAATLLVSGKDFEAIEAAFWKPGKDNEYLVTVQSALRQYTNWWSKNALRGDLSIRDGFLPGDFAATIPVGDARIGVVGLNSTFRQLTAANFRGKLMLDARQLEAVCGSITQWRKQHDACVLLSHHGPEWLTSECREQQYESLIFRPDWFAAHLFGHMHNTALRTFSRGEGALRRQWQGSSWFGLEGYGSSELAKRRHGYAIGQLLFDSETTQLRCFPRTCHAGANSEWRFKRDDAGAELRENDGGTEPVLVAPARKRSSATGKALVVAKRGIGAAQVSAWSRVKAPDTFREPNPAHNPYIGLRFYDIDDEERFAGRDELTGLVIERLMAGFNRQEKAPVVRIDGDSGAGKSSLLRAGVMAHLRQVERMHTVVVRPTDFHNAQGRPHEPIGALLRMIHEQTELHLSAAAAGEVTAAGNGAPHAAVTLLRNRLKGAEHGQAARLIVGLDQFEEIVDDLHSTRFAADWKPLVSFIEDCCRHEEFGFVLTLESSRRAPFKACRFPKPLATPSTVTIDGFNREFLYQIIEKPFRQHGFPLSREVIEGIMESAEYLRRSGPDKPDAGHANSLLPLVSLKLQQIYDKVLERRGVHGQPDQRDLKAEFGGSSVNEITLEEIGGDVDIRSSIADLANAALREGHREWPVPETDLDYFLHPLVRVAHEDAEHFVLNTIKLPTYVTERKLAESFRKRWLLVSAGEDRLRLVHEAVLQHWPAAADWARRTMPRLQAEARLRAQADTRSRMPRRSDPLKGMSVAARNQEIDTALEILASYSRAWTLRTDDVPEEDRPLYELCIDIFDHSTTPHRKVPGSKTESRHVHAAAGYGLIGLLKRFEKIDKRSLDRARPDGQRPIDLASWCQLETVQYLISKGIDPTKPCNSGLRPISGAIRGERRDIFDALIKHHGDDALDGPRGTTLLHACAASGQTDMARFLIEQRRLSARRADMRGLTPFHVAAYEGHAECLDFLAAHSDVTAVDNQGCSALHLAAVHGFPRVIRVLLNRPELQGHEDDLTTAGHTALSIAADNRNVEAVALLLPLTDPNRLVGHLRQTALHRALHDIALGERTSPADIERCWQTLQRLIDDPRTDPNIRDAAGFTPLALAAQHPRLQRLILACPRLDPDQPISRRGETPLIRCVRVRDWVLFRELSQKSRADLSTLLADNDATLLHLLIEYEAPGDLVLEMLARPGCRLDSLDSHGATPLMTAAARGAWPIVRALLKRDPGLPTVRGRSAQSAFALALGRYAPTELWEPLWNREEAALSTPNRVGQTPLHLAALRDARATIEWIVAHSTRAEALWALKDSRGRTPRDLAPGNPAALFPQSWDSCCRWARVPREKRSRLFPPSKPIDGRLRVTTRTTIEWSKLPYYAGESVRIVRLRDDAWGEAVHVYFLYSPRTGLLRLDGTSPPIHTFNKATARRITAATVINYLRFFCYFVRAKGSPFLVLESPRQREIPATATAEEMKQFTKFVRPARLYGWDKKNKTYQLSAVILYLGALFYSDLRVAKTGMVEMDDDEPLAADLPAASLPLISG
jgi:ankyrin repeat protein